MSNDLYTTIIEHYDKRSQIPEGNAYVIGATLRACGVSPSMLVFGVGYDTRLWDALNKDGYTMFVENDTEWFNNISRTVSSPVRLIGYGTRTVADSLPIKEEDLRRHTMPAMLNRSWDVILIDSPRGSKPTDPGRSLPIYWASLLATPSTHVFIDDASRELEQTYIEHFFAHRPWHTNLPRCKRLGKANKGHMYWAIGAPNTREI